MAMDPPAAARPFDGRVRSGHAGVGAAPGRALFPEQRPYGTPWSRRDPRRARAAVLPKPPVYERAIPAAKPGWAPRSWRSGGSCRAIEASTAALEAGCSASARRSDWSFPDFAFEGDELFQDIAGRGGGSSHGLEDERERRTAEPARLLLRRRVGLRQIEVILGAATVGEDLAAT